jgi:hypothetical protein
MSSDFPPWAQPGSGIEPERELSHLQAWVRLPTAWIEARGLLDFVWARGAGSDNIAALMTLAVIAHHANQETGSVRLTWDDLCDRTFLSRAKLSKGLDRLSGQKIILRKPDGRSRFQLVNFNPERDWAKFPARGLYTKQGVLRAFKDFKLRSRAELDALKLYFLFAARRDRKSNVANLSYEKIWFYSGVHPNFIRTAVSLLAGQALVHVSSQPSSLNDHGTSNQYRLTHIDPTRHPGTIGRHSL